MTPASISRTARLALVAGAIAVLGIAGARAGGSHYYPPVTDPLTAEECGGCHLAFPPSMLPAASWRTMMGQLDRHFGDDASLGAEATASIARYLIANAGDAGGRRTNDGLLRGLAPGAAPQRITELPRWVREHREIRPAEWSDPKVRSRANCVACHADAERGYFDD